MTGSAASGAEAFAVLAAVARTLAGGDDRRLDEALSTVADALSVPATLTLREAGRRRGGQVLATSGLTLVPAQAKASTALLDIPLRHAGHLAAALCVVADAPLGSDDLLLLAAAADVLSLSLGQLLPLLDAGRHVLEIEEERSDVAAALGDGPLPALVAALHVCESAPSPATEHVRTALDELRRVEQSLLGRSLAGDLAVSVRAAVAASRRTGTEVRLDLPASVLPCSPVHAVTAYHVVLAALAGVRSSARVTVSLPADGDLLVLDVTGAENPYDTGTLARWARRATALDGRLDRHADGVTLQLPWSAGPTGTDAPVQRIGATLATTVVVP